MAICNYFHTCDTHWIVYLHSSHIVLWLEIRCTRDVFWPFWLVTGRTRIVIAQWPWYSGSIRKKCLHAPSLTTHPWHIDRLFIVRSSAVDWSVSLPSEDKYLGDRNRPIIDRYLFRHLVNNWLMFDRNRFNQSKMTKTKPYRKHTGTLRITWPMRTDFGKIADTSGYLPILPISAPLERLRSLYTI